MLLTEIGCIMCEPIAIRFGSPNLIKTIRLGTTYSVDNYSSLVSGMDCRNLAEKPIYQRDHTF